MLAGHAAGFAPIALAAGAAVGVPLSVARQRAETQRRRAAFLADAARTLNSSLEPEETLRRLARLTVPAVCDWCIVDLLEDDGIVRRVAVSHGSDGERPPRDLDERFRPDLEADSPLTRALRTGETQLVELVLRAGAREDQHLLALRELGIRSAVVAPLGAREHVAGALVFGMAESGRRYREEDRGPAAGLASQVALAIDNARLFAETREAERRAQDDRALVDALFFAAPIGLGFFDRDLRYQRVNDALAAIHGVPAADHIGRGLDEIVPGIDSAVPELLRGVMETGEPIVDREVEGATPAEPGGVRHWLASYYPVRGRDGAVIGLGAVTIEVTERRRSQDELRAQKELYEAILRAQSDVGEGFLILEDERIVYANQAAEIITGHDAAALRALPSLFHLVRPDMRERLRTRVRSRREDPAADAIEHTTVLHREGHEVALELAVTPLGGPEDHRIVVVARDVTARRQAEQERTELLAAERIARAAAETSQRRATFLAEASVLLDTSLALDQTFANVTELCVPYLAEFCSVSIAEPTGEVRRMAFHVEDPEQREVLSEIDRRWPMSGAQAAHPLTDAVSSGRTEVFREIPDRILEQVAEDEEHLALLRRARMRTVVVAPLRARGRTLGAIAIGRWQGPDYNPTEIALLEELAMRAGLAIDNSRLYEERSYIARTLQNSLLPPRLPEIPGVETAARYRAAGEGIEVGGDFYDVFETIDARWGVAVGDVCGKGARAAAITSLARHTLRAAAMQERLPSEALLMLNEALRRQEVDTDFCTVAYAHLRPTPGGEVALLLANGGHPPPLLLRADGDVTAVGRSGTLLGVVPDPRLPDTALTLSPGDALVLYTDGVTEARTPDGMFGSDRLEELVRSCAGLGAGAIADVIERAVMDVQNGDARDDIAILVLKASANGR